jgi:dephospho-CoA kinase
LSEAEDPFVIGITGTIASGKSAVGKILTTRGIPVFDSDQIVHDLLTDDTATRRAVTERFGAAIVRSDQNGAIDRAALGKIVFSDSDARRDLEAIVHPAVIAESHRRIHEHPSNAIVAILAPLLFEAGLRTEYNEIWTVFTNLETLKQRLRQRDSLSDAEVERRLAAQWSQEKKAALSDYVIDNSGTSEETTKQVDDLLEKLKVKISL